MSPRVNATHSNTWTHQCDGEETSFPPISRRYPPALSQLKQYFCTITIHVNQWNESPLSVCYDDHKYPPPLLLPSAAPASTAVSINQVIHKILLSPHVRWSHVSEVGKKEKKKKITMIMMDDKESHRRPVRVSSTFFTIRAQPLSMVLKSYMGRVQWTSPK